MSNDKLLKVIGGLSDLLSIVVPAASPYAVLAASLVKIAAKADSGEDLTDEDLDAISQARDLNVQAFEDAVNDMPDDQPEVDAADPGND